MQQQNKTVNRMYQRVNKTSQLFTHCWCTDNIIFPPSTLNANMKNEIRKCSSVWLDYDGLFLVVRMMMILRKIHTLFLIHSFPLFFLKQIQVERIKSFEFFPPLLPFFLSFFYYSTRDVMIMRFLFADIRRKEWRMNSVALSWVALLCIRYFNLFLISENVHDSEDDENEEVEISIFSRSNSLKLSTTTMELKSYFFLEMMKNFHDDDRNSEKIHSNSFLWLIFLLVFIRFSTVLTLDWDLEFDMGRTGVVDKTI